MLDWPKGEKLAQLLMEGVFDTVGRLKQPGLKSA